jgi:hypothetical protein
VHALDRSRTCNNQFRKLRLYPIELRGRMFIFYCRNESIESPTTEHNGATKEQYPKHRPVPNNFIDIEGLIDCCKQYSDGYPKCHHLGGTWSSITSHQIEKFQAFDPKCKQKV